MSHSAAIFDLDRTLLRGSSGPIFGDAMRAAGLLGPKLPGEDALASIFNIVGETVPSMLLARQAATLAKGKSQSSVQLAAAAAAVALAESVGDRVPDLLADHRSAGRLLVLATTTPIDLVAPLATMLGIDHVVATRYGVTERGDYDGTIDGHFVWSAGKLAAVSEWAAAADVDLDASYFYSDSVYDTPLLTAVGNPVVVNPDPRLRLLATARRWPIVSLHSGRSSVLPAGWSLQRLALMFAAARVGAICPIRYRGPGTPTRRGPGDRVREPSQLLRCCRGRNVARVGRPNDPVPR